MKLIPIASDSIGVRSLSHLIEVSGLRVLVDAGAALAPRFGLFPHPIEYRRLRAVKERIRELSKKANIIFISHYHYDHYTPAWNWMEWKWTWSGIEEAERIYSGKVIWAKDPNVLINHNQRMRAGLFFKASSFVDRVYKFIRTKTNFEGVEVEFSTFHHGSNDSPLGYVLSLKIGEYLYLSDVQGPGTDEALYYALSIEPEYCILSGPPVYLSEMKVSKGEIESSLSRLLRLSEAVKKLIIDHHLMRSLESLHILEQIKRHAKAYNHDALSFADLLGMKPELLEARRKELYMKYPPEDEFIKWVDHARRRPPSSPPPL